jgi:hypothetical protein
MLRGAWPNPPIRARRDVPDSGAVVPLASASPRRAIAGFGLALALLCTFGAVAEIETEVYLVRGWFGVFSTGMDTIAGQLREKGVKAEAINHWTSRSVVEKIVSERAAGHGARLVLVGHSQGANNAIEMARELKKHDIKVDLLIALVPFMQDPVPSNVVRALNYYQSPGWGTPLEGDPDFKGKLSNIDVGKQWSTYHITIDKTSEVQAAIVKDILSLAP